LSASEFWKLVASVHDPGVLLGQTEEELDGSVGAKLAKRVYSLLDRATALAFRIEELEQAGVQTLSAFDEGYPARWRERLNGGAPPAMHAVGAVDLLDAGGLAIVGSRDVDQAGADVARAAATIAAREGKVVISGGARGTDRLAMTAALESDGRIAGVLADSLLKTTRDPEVRRAIGDSQLCLVTPYAPEAPFNAGNAMGRNKLIYTLADVTFVVASDHDKGGTWSGATEALAKDYGRVAVWLGEGGGPGNKPLAELGAVPVTHIEQLGEVSSTEDRIGEQLGLGL
jgi:predicted Rossmann fold nucleotide-binding protein DprA/Smf involved in DNA uptake